MIAEFSSNHVMLDSSHSSSHNNWLTFSNRLAKGDLLFREALLSEGLKLQLRKESATVLDDDLKTTHNSASLLSQTKRFVGAKADESHRISE